MESLLKKQKKYRDNFYKILYTKYHGVDIDDMKKYSKNLWQWADKSYNIQKSDMKCPNRCKYCYAHRMATRFGREQKELDITVTDKIRVNKKWNDARLKLVYMFPSAHDIFLENVDDYIKVAINILNAGHDIICVSKPRIKCIKKICKAMSKLPKKMNIKQRFQFRFTICSDNNEILKDWEPFAPSLDERIESLKYAFEHGFVTSISIEPILDNPDKLIKLITPYITPVKGSIWIGYMSNCPSDIDIEDSHIEKRIKAEKNMKNIVDSCKDNPLIFYKGSVIKELIKNHV